MKRPIAIGLAPNLTPQDISLALKLLLFPWKLYKGDSIRLLEQWFRQFFSVSYAISFVSGRASLLAILKALAVKPGDEVIVQAFTCVAVINPILDLGCKPVYVDITNKLTLDSSLLEEKISKKTKAIIMQHTFGIPSDIEKIKKIASKYKLFLIEDCAHTIGGTYKEKKLGTFGVASFFSFGRDKVCSSVFGGMVVTNDEKLGKTIRSIQKNQAFPSLFWILQQLFHPIAFGAILPLYNLYIGKLILIVLQKIHFLSFPVSLKEKQGKKNAVFLKKLPNALATLVLSQVRRVNEFNKKRQEFVKQYIELQKEKNIILLYAEEEPLLRFPVLVEERDNLLEKFKKQNIYLGNWYANTIDPKGVDFRAIGYQRGSCPKAEYIASRILNLPTYPMLKKEEVEKIILLLKEFKSQN